MANYAIVHGRGVSPLAIAFAFSCRLTPDFSVIRPGGNLAQNLNGQCFEWITDTQN